ncbi:MAG: FecR domain-containing protein [Cytophagales bacterium]|nr:FecR domain-containing protein [Cytophagales bacterium]
MKKEISDLLLDERFRNWSLKSDLDDYNHWEKHFKEHPDEADIAQKAKEIILLVELEEPTLPEDKNRSSLQKLNNTIDQQEIEKQKADVPGLVSDAFYEKKRQILSYKTRVFIAAAISFFIVFIWLINSEVNKNDGQKSIDLVKIVKRADYGKKLTFVLPDGSKVNLNSGSELKYHSNFADSRQVDLIGEARFEVVRDEDHPFRIKSQGVTTTVLGTTFNVKAYSDEKLSVSVVSGRVLVEKKLEDTVEDIILKKEESTEFDDESQQFRYREYNKDELAWNSGLLVFDDSSLTDVEKKLEKWYGVQVDIQSDVVFNENYSGKYLNSTLEEVLMGMSFVLEFEFKITNKKVSIYR